jgi:hypothetical protein
MEIVCKVIAICFLFVVILGCSSRVTEQRNLSSALPFHIMGISFFLLMIMIVNVVVCLE